ncbi:MAG: FIST C-terminal domain-containing protein [Bacillota bacterium]|nr:FIST C-terminal domain-containing protein [Bacillota bacterium]
MFLQSFDEFKDYVASLQLKESEELMILVGDKSSGCVEELIQFINGRNIRFFGGIFPELLVKDKSYPSGFIIQRYEPVYSSIVLPYLMRFKLSLEEIADCTAIVLVDGLTSKFKELTDTVYGKIGDSVRYIGGGAGFYDLKHRPCIFNNTGLHEDALHICIVKQKVELAVKHGWNKLQGPFLVTEAHGNVLSRLDNYDAFSVYRDVIEDEERVTLYKEDFFIYAKDHPFGYTKKGQYDLIVRDPIALNDYNEIICVADIPSDTEVYVLKGNENTLLSSSLEIAEYLSQKAPDRYLPLLFDCISRAMFLDNRFDEELKNIQNKLRYTVEGALSIGEIASNKSGGIIIHNKSTILGLLEQ